MHVTNQAVRIVLGVVRNAVGEVLIAQRAATAHQGGLWEFPGGKSEAGESDAEALQRELQEEVGIVVKQQCPLIQIRHRYPDVDLVLQVQQVTAWEDEAVGREGQPLRWVLPSTLHNYAMPAANQAIVQALQLPDCYVITPSICGDLPHWLAGLRQVLLSGYKLIQLRVTDLSQTEYVDLVRVATDLCQAAGATLMLNTEVTFAQQCHAQGVHLNAQRLWHCRERPAGLRWLAASCHSPADIQQAQAIGADFVVLSPVLPTLSHPQASPLGWPKFAEWVVSAQIPVYALGGMTAHDLPQARQMGAQGIAGIRGLWRTSESKSG
jgi:8-oxo-dGTP diphosphatase